MKTLPERSAYAKAQRQERAGVVEEVPGDQCVGALWTHAESLRGGEERGWAHRGPPPDAPHLRDQPFTACSHCLNTVA